jgi:hypothetical protein
MASMIASFNMTKALDEHGKVIEPEFIFDNPFFR